MLLRQQSFIESLDLFFLTPRDGSSGMRPSTVCVVVIPQSDLSLHGGRGVMGISPRNSNMADLHEPPTWALHPICSSSDLSFLQQGSSLKCLQEPTTMTGVSTVQHRFLHILNFPLASTFHSVLSSCFPSLFRFRPNSRSDCHRGRNRCVQFGLDRKWLQPPQQLLCFQPALSWHHQEGFWRPRQWFSSSSALHVLQFFLTTGSRKPIPH